MHKALHECIALLAFELEFAFTPLPEAIQPLLDIDGFADERAQHKGNDHEHRMLSADSAIAVNDHHAAQGSGDPNKKCSQTDTAHDRMFKPSRQSAFNYKSNGSAGKYGADID